MNLLIILAAKYLYLAVLIIAVFFVFKTTPAIRKNIIKLSILALPISFTLSRILSHFIYTIRPFVIQNVTPLIAHAPDNGFPSDHTLLATTVAATLLIYDRNVGILLAILSLTIGISRIVAKVHGPVDIFGSFIIAFFAVYAVKVVLDQSKIVDSLIDKILIRLKIR